MRNRWPVRWGEVGIRVIVHAILCGAAVVIAFPFYWMVVSTIRPESEVYTVALNLLPSRLSFDMYRKLLSDPQLPVVRFFLNSVIISVGTTVVNIATAVLAAYALSRHKVPGGMLFYYLIIATMMVPGEVVLIGLFRVVNALNMIDSYMGMILPLAVNAVNFLLIYNYMLALPREQDEAAVVDGARTWQVLLHVTLPALLVFVLTQRFVFSGITAGAIKG